jgi:DNA polymerase-3 subunit beta
MKIIFKQEALLKCLKEAVRFVPSSTTKQALKHVLIFVSKENDRVDLYASGEDASLRRSMFDTLIDSSVTIEESGTILLPAKELYEIAKSAASEIVLESQDSLHVTLTFGKTKYELTGLQPDLFRPYENDKESTSTVCVPATALRTMLHRTTYACSTSDARPIMTGVNFSVSEGAITAVATDGLRLAQYGLNDVTVDGEARELPVPKDTLERLAALLPKDDDEQVYLEIGDTSLVATWDDEGVRLIMRGLSGVYPNASRIIPEEVAHRIMVDRQLLLESCERISVLSDKQLAELRFKGEELELFAEAPAHGRALDKMPIQKSSGVIMTLFVNVGYIQQLLRSFDGIESVIFGIVQADRPFTVIPGAGAPGLALVAPIQHAAAASETSESQQQSA